MNTDLMVYNENETSIADKDTSASEKYNGEESVQEAGNTILTTASKSKIKIIINHNCKSWTYHKGDLV